MEGDGAKDFTVIVEVKSLGRLTLCDPMDCSLPGFSVHGIFQARVLEWVAISFSRRSAWPRDQTQVSRTAGRHFTLWATREAPYNYNHQAKNKWSPTDPRQLPLRTAAVTAEIMLFFSASASLKTIRLY